MPQLDDYLKQIASLPGLIAGCADSLEPPTRRVLSTPEIYGLRRLILTGSGDSYFAAASVVPTFRALTGLPVQAMPSMEASRYAGGFEKSVVNARRTLVIAISYSGEAARLVEAAQRWRERGALTLGVTGASTGRLAKAVERTVDTRVDEVAPAPGTRTYVVGLIALNLLAIRLAEVLMHITMDEAGQLRRQLIQIGGRLQDVDAKLAEPIRAFAEHSRDAQAFDVLGSGPSLGAAGYGAAKLTEAAGVHAIAQDSEEFFHLNFFTDRPTTIPTILYAPTEGLAASRSRELTETLAQLGRPSLVVTDERGFGGDTAELLLPRVSEWLAPVVQSVPASLLAAYAANIRGSVHYRGHDGPWIGARGATLVRNSSIDLNHG